MLLSGNTAAIGLGQAGLYALLGYCVVFFGLILLMLVIIFIGKIFIAAQKCEEAQNIPAVCTPSPAPGSAGELKLYNVEPKTAAMIMAIVAYKMNQPINELRFLSIREVQE